MPVLREHQELTNEELIGATKELIQLRYDLISEFAKLRLEISGAGTMSDMGVIASQDATLRAVDMRMASLLAQQGI